LRRSAPSAKHPNLRPHWRAAIAHDGVSLIEVMVDSAVPLLYGQKS